MNIGITKVIDLKQDESNARRHSQSNIDAVKSSLENYGQQKPIVIDADKNIIAGNCTVLVASQLGWETVMTVTTELNTEEAIAYAIADNRSSELGEWEGDVLKFLVESNEIDLESIGFDVSSFNIATGEADWGGTDIADVPNDVTDPTAKIIVSCEVSMKNEVEEAIKDLIYKSKWDEVTIKT
jgi:hypothetical protein